jgi:Rrf2 family protein
MQLTRAADYAVRVMTYLASEPEGTVVSKTVLAREADAPDSFVSKILQSLARAGLVEGRRGVEGGFVLLERGAQASLLEVVESIDGPIALNACLGAEGSCNRSRSCAAHAVWRQAQEAMLTVLREAKIAEMAHIQGCGGSLRNSEVAWGEKPHADKGKKHGWAFLRPKR